MKVSREQLKNQIDILDGAYLELAYKIICQLPRLPVTQENTTSQKKTFSQRWRGKLGRAQFKQAELEADPKLAYLADRYQL